MKYLLRRIGVLIIAALFVGPATLLAQDSSGSDPLVLVGSGIVTPVLDAVAAANTTPLSTTATGTNQGLAAFCNGDADLVAAARPLSDSEEIACLNAGVTFAELLVGYNIAAFVTSADSTVAECLTSDQVSTLFAPSAAGQITDWSQINSDNAAAPITSLVPPEDSAVFDLLDSVVEGVGVRADAQTLAVDAIAAAVAADANAIGVVPLTAVGDLRVLALNAGPAGCTAPSASSVGSVTYPAGAGQYVYVDAALLTDDAVVSFLTAAATSAADEALSAAALVAPTEEERASNTQTITEARTGRTFSAAAAAFTIPAGVTGAVTISGAGHGAELLTAAVAGFNGSYPGVTITTTTNGQVAGYRQLCNGEVDLVTAFSGLTDEQTANCTANNITPFTLALGSTAAILVGNAETEFLQCLTLPQIVSAFGAQSAEAVANWSQVDAAFADTPLTVFAPTEGSDLNDLLMFSAGAAAVPTRADVQLDDDAAYRAAATANVVGGVALLSWSDYQDVLTSGQANLRLLAVDGGDGCVEPTFESIASGEYPLTRALDLVINRTALSRTEVQSFLWYLISDDNYAQIEAAGLLGVTFDGLTDLRAALQSAYNDAVAAAAVAPEVSAEATPEATPEATVEATPAS